MSNPINLQKPLQLNGEPIYPLTSAKQVLMADGTRLDAFLDGFSGGGVEIPETLPNPHKLIFTGAVTAEYDGSKDVTVDVPAGGGGASSGVVPWSNVKANLIVDMKITADDTGALPKYVEITQRDNGTPLNLKAFVIKSDIVSTYSYTEINFNNNHWAQGFEFSHNKAHAPNTFIVCDGGVFSTTSNPAGFIPFGSLTQRGVALNAFTQIDRIELPTHTHTMKSGSFVKIWELLVEE